jgi:hypothetical protein
MVKVRAPSKYIDTDAKVSIVMAKENSKSRRAFFCLNVINDDTGLKPAGATIRCALVFAALPVTAVLLWRGRVVGVVVAALLSLF